MTELDQHREAVDRALTAAGLGWDAWPDAATSGALDSSARLSALLLMLGLAAPRVAHGGDYEEFLDPTVDAIDRLRRHKLPWDAASARTALRTVTALEDFDHRRVTVALRGAEQVCASGQADTALLDALHELSRRLDEVAIHRWQVPQTQELARRVLVAASPPELLDLTLVRDGDQWGAAARAAARQVPADAVAPLVRLLGELGTRKPSRTWLAAVSSALADRTGPSAAAPLARAGRRDRRGAPRLGGRRGVLRGHAVLPRERRHRPRGGRRWRSSWTPTPRCPICSACSPVAVPPPAAYPG